MDEKSSIGAQHGGDPNDMDVSESVNAGKSGAIHTQIREELPLHVDVVISQRISNVMMNPSVTVIDHDQIVLQSSSSSHSHSTRSRSPSKADSVTSNMSTSSEFMSSHIIHESSHKVDSRSPLDDFNRNDERNLLMTNKKTVSSDELNSENHDSEVQNYSGHEPNRERSDSIPYIFRDSNTSPSLSGKALRRGKWTQEEEAFVARAINDFNCGFLNVPAGTTLRTYLSDKLQCNPMRVTKKFTGDACIGKRVFHPAVRSESNAAAIDKAQIELEALESRWRRRLESQHKESQKKTNSTAPNTTHNIQNPLLETVVPTSLRENALEISQAVSWLEQANSVLSHDSSSKQDYETEMEQVQRLIFEAPIIHNISTSLSSLAESSRSNPTTQLVTSNDSHDIQRKVLYKTPPASSPIIRPIAIDHVLVSGADFRSYPSKETRTKTAIPSPPPQDEKRLRTSSAQQDGTPPCIEESAAEDAATLMDFLFSVRNEASAASKT